MLNNVFSKTSRIIQATNTTGTSTFYTNNRGLFGNTVVPEAVRAYSYPQSGYADVYGRVYRNGKYVRNLSLGSAFNSSSGYPSIKNDNTGRWWCLNWYARNQSGSNTQYGIPFFKGENISNITAASYTTAGNFVDFSDFAINGNNVLYVSRHNLYGSSTLNNYYYYYNASTNTWTDGNAPTPLPVVPKHLGIIGSGFFLLWASGSDLYYATFDGTSWTTPTVVLNNIAVNSATNYVSSLSVDNHLRITIKTSANNLGIITRTSAGVWAVNQQSGYNASPEAKIIEVGSNALLLWDNGTFYSLATFIGGVYNGIISPGGGTNFRNIIKLKDGALFIELDSGVPQIMFNPTIAAGLTGTTKTLKTGSNVTISGASSNLFLPSGKSVTQVLAFYSYNLDETILFLRR